MLLRCWSRPWAAFLRLRWAPLSRFPLLRWALRLSIGISDRGDARRLELRVGIILRLPWISLAQDQLVVHADLRGVAGLLIHVQRRCAPGLKDSCTGSLVGGHGYETGHQVCILGGFSASLYLLPISKRSLGLYSPSAFRLIPDHARHSPAELDNLLLHCAPLSTFRTLFLVYHKLS